MKTTYAVWRTRTFSLVLGLFLTVFGWASNARADAPLCPNCPDLLGTVTLDVELGKLILEVDAFPGFDAGEVDAVELVLLEGPYIERLEVNFSPDDLDNPIWEQHDLPDTIRGEETTAFLRFFDTTSGEEVLVPIEVRI